MIVDIKNEELKPCPFCGGKPLFHRSYIKYRGELYDTVLVQCWNCKVQTRDVVYDKTKHGEGGEYKEVADTWNNRTQGNIYDMFPHIYWTKRNPMHTLEDKINKLTEEAAEAAEADYYTDIIDETLDVMHCCVEILRDCPKKLLFESLLAHNFKNKDRGYYEPKKE